MAVIHRYIEILTVGVFLRSNGILHSKDSFPSIFRPRLWDTSSGESLQVSSLQRLAEVKSLPFMQGGRIRFPL